MRSPVNDPVSSLDPASLHVPPMTGSGDSLQQIPWALRVRSPVSVMVPLPVAVVVAMAVRNEAEITSPSMQSQLQAIFD